MPLLLGTLREITRVVSVPVTADIEAGYSDVPAEVGETVAAVIDAGVVGINLEDGAGSPDALCAKIGAARQAAIRRGVPIFVNARTDVFLRRLVTSDAAVCWLPPAVPPWTTTRFYANLLDPSRKMGLEPIKRALKTGASD